LIEDCDAADKGCLTLGKSSVPVRTAAGLTGGAPELLLRFVDSCSRMSGTWQEVASGSGGGLDAVCARLHGIFSAVAASCPRVKLAFKGSDAYARLHAIRKVVLGWASGRRHCDVSLWSGVSIELLQKAAPDEGGHLGSLPASCTSAEDVSELMFGRPDWALFASMFACLWNGVVKKGLVTPKDMCNIVMGGVPS